MRAARYKSSTGSFGHAPFHSDIIPENMLRVLE